jgi:hypothetical protein
MAVLLTERPYEVCFSRNPIVYRLQTDTALDTAGLRIDVRLLHRKFGTASFVQIFEISLIPDSAGLVSVDVSKTLDSLTNYKLPGISSQIIEQAFDHAGEFYVQYREATTATPNPSWTSDSSNTIVAIKGGLPYQAWQGPNYFINYNGILTWQKTGRLIGPSEKSWLTYLHLGANNQANMSAKINVYYTDGTSSLNAVTLTFPDDEIPIYALYHIPTGAQLALKDLDSTKVIQYYTVRVVADTTNLTVEFRYNVDYRNNYSSTTLHWFNSLGGLDSVRLLGELNKKTVYERQYAEKTLGGAYYSTTELATMQENIKNQEQETYAGSVGLMDDPDMYDRLRDLMLSNKVWQIRFSRWRPVLITNTNIDHGNEGDPIKDFPVEFTPGYVNESYAPDIRIGDLPTCPVITGLTATFGVISWTGNANHVQYVIERWDVLQTSVQEVVYTASTSYEFTEFGLIGYVRVKAVCGFSETPFTDFVYLMV